MKYLIAGGGTGGHIYPAVSIAHALKAADPQAELLYVGTQAGREATLVPREQIPFVTISSAGLINLSAMQKLKGALKAAKGLFDSLGHIRRFRPDVVIGTGGFVSGPVLLAARLAGRPVVIQEQNAFPGVTNRIASRWAKAVLVPYEEARPYFPAGTKLQFIGNPVRPEVQGAERSAGRKAFGYTESDKVLVVMGGSGGGRDFNRFAVDAVKLLLGRLPGLKVLHITGERYFDQVRQQYGGSPAGVSVVPYLHNMPEAYAAADAGIFRSGALTLAEVQVRGLPSVLIPSPNVTHNHQDWNARTLEQRGAALVVREREMSADKLADAVAVALTDSAKRAAMAEALRSLAQPDAAADIAGAIMKIARRD
ncbi:MAG: UDP-N-acetylglucosamine-N-acetylmuramyl-pyrophosphoryl-undecaprenol N-acetylglucosamine transferase [Symbiobacteriaceae bacterium]|jgi:UDP-N-acetylglucosamine--N-acetylmuramyl-(pentapeptide) pyrophosphoryl-undecaprenol N-acetylglucosamine transferase|nr:UDP-N-acetylglucosamine-N-acetylmuramyl-pyrophosphoryl-undecaprenol N-acetylglucosamine transferase [Symbiobacteriaceae bacterium]